jgi:hypothetical protein
MEYLVLLLTGITTIASTTQAYFQYLRQREKKELEDLNKEK